jgi:hypothetical protein
MENQIKINFEPVSDTGSSTMTWHYGDVEVDGKEYEFSISEMFDSNSGTSEFEFTWCNEVPNNDKHLESEVMNRFYDI